MTRKNNTKKTLLIVLGVICILPCFGIVCSIFDRSPQISQIKTPTTLVAPKLSTEELAWQAAEGLAWFKELPQEGKVMIAVLFCALKEGKITKQKCFDSIIEVGRTYGVKFRE